METKGIAKANSAKPVKPVKVVNVEELESLSYLQLVWRKFRRHKLAIVGAIMIIMLLLLAIFGPMISPYDFESIDLSNMKAPPSWEHIFGTDDLGRDIFTRILYGGRISLLVGFASAFTAVFFGIMVGALAGFYGKILDNVLMRFTDMMMTIPTLPLLIVFSTLLKGSVGNIILLMVLFSWMSTARLVRGAVLTFKQQEFIEAARALGVNSGRIIFRHLLPNAMAPAVVSATLMVGGNIIWESSLSFLGLGIQPPTPSWGNMLSGAQDYIYTVPWLAIWPGLFILITVLGFNFLGDGLRDALDPRSKQD